MSTAAPMRRAKNAASMRSLSSKLQARRRIDESGLYAAQARKRPSLLRRAPSRPNPPCRRRRCLRRSTDGGAAASAPCRDGCGSSSCADSGRRPAAIGRAAGSLAPRARMGSVVDLREMAEVELGVDLRRRDVGVAEQLLHRAQVAARLQHMRRERVAQHVRVDVCRHAGGDRARLQARAHLARRQSRAAAADEERRLDGSRAMSARRASQAPSAASAGAPTGTARRLLPLPRTCAVASAASIQPAPRRSRPRRGRPARRRAGRSRRAARRCTRRGGEAVVLVVAMRDQRDRVVDRERLRQRLRGARRAHAIDRVGIDQAAAAEPAIKAAPRREDERDRARREPAACSCAAKRRTCCVFASRSGSAILAASRSRRSNASP